MLSFSLFCALLAGVMLDCWLGEPRRWHPLVGFGRLAMAVEERLNRQGAVVAGAVAVLITVAPWVLAVVVLLQVLPGWAGWGLQALGLWLVIGGRSLGEHGRAVIAPLQDGDLMAAREQVARMVSRDTAALDEQGVARAATESVLENGADALFASLFWFALAGLPGALLHRLVNTLDAMWGYRTDRFERFGKVAARLDDVLGWAPARLTALAGTGQEAAAGSTAREVSTVDHKLDAIKIGLGFHGDFHAVHGYGAKPQIDLGRNRSGIHRGWLTRLAMKVLSLQKKLLEKIQRH